MKMQKPLPKPAPKVGKTRTHPVKWSAEEMAAAGKARDRREAELVKIRSAEMKRLLKPSKAA